MNSILWMCRCFLAVPILIGICFLHAPVRAVVVNHPYPWPIYPAYADSLFIGVGLCVKDPLADVIVINQSLGLKTARDTGNIYVLCEHFGDSSRFLFDNNTRDDTDFPDTINLGRFAASTILTFAFHDISSIWPARAGKWFYSGQNREGIDQYISEFGYNERFWGTRRFAAGRIDSNSVECSFSIDEAFPYNDAIFHVTNVLLVGKEVFVAPLPHIAPPAGESEAPFTATFSIIEEGLVNKFTDHKGEDTVVLAAYEGVVSFEYALTGSSGIPGAWRTGSSVMIEENATVAVRAICESPKWIPSPIVNAFYTLPPVKTSRGTSGSPGILPSVSSGNVAYSLNGRRIVDPLRSGIVMYLRQGKVIAKANSTSKYHNAAAEISLPE